MRNISGQRFGRLVALRPTKQRRCGAVVWECVCDCGNTAYTTSNDMCRGKTRSCGCLRRDKVSKAHTFEPKANDGIQEKPTGQKPRKSNTSGYRGVGYCPKTEKYTARIGFQYQSHYLGAYQRIDDAIEVRKKAEMLIWETGDQFYAHWKEKAAADPAWAKEHPVQIRVTKKEEEGYSVVFSPKL